MLAGSGKFDNTSTIAASFSEWGYPLWFMYLVGVCEISGGILLIIPKTRRLGVFVLSIVMLGAIITHLMNFTSMGYPILPLGIFVMLVSIYFIIPNDKIA